MKKPWGKPKLVVLVRTKTDESVLGNCKGHSDYGPPTEAGCTQLGGRACRGSSKS